MVRKIGPLVLAVAMLSLTGCGGGDDGPDTAASTASTTTSRSEPPDDRDESGGADYDGALLTIDDLGFLSTDFEVVEEGDTAGTSMRGVCGRDAGAVTATAGHAVQMIGSGQSASVAPSVRAFESEADARTAFDVAKAQAKVCDTITNFVDSEGADFERLPTPLIQDAGQESVTLFTRKTDTGLVVADHFVRQGPYVLSIRFALSETSPVTESIAGTIATEASRKFENWTEEQ